MTVHLFRGVVIVGVLFFSASVGLSAQIVTTPPGTGSFVRLREPRITPLPEDEWTAEQLALVEKYSSQTRIGNGFRTMLRVPELVEAVMPFVLFTPSDSTLSPRHRELLILRTAWLCQASSIWADHAPLARTVGITPLELESIAKGPNAEGWDPFESSLLSLADELFRHSSVQNVTWTELADRYDLYNLFDAVMVVNEYTLLGMLYNSWGVQPDPSAQAKFPESVQYRLELPEPDPPLTVPRIEPVEGSGIRVRRTFARYPELQEARSGQSGYVNRVSPLTPYFREMLILRIGWNCQSVYEWAKHVGSVGRARDHGLDPRRIAMGASAGWNIFEAAHIRAADEIYRDGIISDATWTLLSDQYDTREMMSVVMTVANYRLVSMSLNALGVQPQDTDELFPDLGDQQ